MSDIYTQNRNDEDGERVVRSEFRGVAIEGRNDTVVAVYTFGDPVDDCLIHNSYDGETLTDFMQDSVFGHRDNKLGAHYAEGSQAIYDAQTNPDILESLQHINNAEDFIVNGRRIGSEPPSCELFSDNMQENGQVSTVSNVGFKVQI